MAIRYETVQIVVPAGGSARETILTVPDGKKYTLRAIAVIQNASYQQNVYIRNTRIIEIASGLSMYYGNFVPMDDLLDKPVNVDVEIQDLGGGALSPYITLMYEE